MVVVEWVALDGLTTVLNHDHLHNECENCDTEEQKVVEEATEHIEFAVLDLSGIDLVEKLHEHKDLEHKGVVQQLLSHGSPFVVIVVDVSWKSKGRLVSPNGVTVEGSAVWICLSV